MIRYTFCIVVIVNGRCGLFLFAALMYSLQTIINYFKLSLRLEQLKTSTFDHVVSIYSTKDTIRELLIYKKMVRT